MKIVSSITSEPRQRHVIKLDNNESAIFKLYYYPSQQSWYFDIEYKDYINRGNKIVLTYNALRHLRNKIPFGIAFLATNNADPFQLDDFTNNNVIVLQLNQEDVQEIEELVYNVR